ncbi:MAG: hypothetical protein L0387_41550, partial [Acidobacteria bacterium]|nr:hypothetical protein [Acidobacteriota bacterium]
MYTNRARLIILAAALLQWVGTPFSQTAHITGRITDATALWSLRLRSTAEHGYRNQAFDDVAQGSVEVPLNKGGQRFRRNRAG